MNISHWRARDVEAYALSMLTVARSREGQDHRTPYSPLGRRGSRMKASAGLKAAVIWAIAKIDAALAELR